MALTPLPTPHTHTQINKVGFKFFVVGNPPKEVFYILNVNVYEIFGPRPSHIPP